MPCPGTPDGAIALPGEGNQAITLRTDGLHEFYAAGKSDAAACNGLAFLMLHLRQREDTRPAVWLRETGAARSLGHPYGPGLVELTGAVSLPQRITLIALPDPAAVLRAALDCARDGSLSAVLIELAGRQPLLDLTSSRRFALAAAASDTMILIARGPARPVPSAAHTRWQIAAAPSAALAAKASGAPAFALDLLRRRGGRDGLRFILEWNRDTTSFRLRNGPAADTPLSRPASAVAFGGTGDSRRSRAA